MGFTIFMAGWLLAGGLAVRTMRKVDPDMGKFGLSMIFLMGIVGLVGAVSSWFCNTESEYDEEPKKWRMSRLEPYDEYDDVWANRITGQED